MRHRRKSASRKSDDAESLRAIHLEPEIVVVSDSSEDQPIQRPKKKRKARLTVADNEEDEDTGRAKNETDSDANVGVPVRWISKGRWKGKRPQIADTESDSELQNGKRKLIKGVRPSTPEDLSAEIDTESKSLMYISSAGSFINSQK
jgi:hypothetical protein